MLHTRARDVRDRSRAAHTALVALAALLAAAATFSGAPAHAQTSAADGQSVDSLRAQADAIATSYFAALTRTRQLDDEITDAEQLVETLESNADAARAAATTRAVAAYRQAGSRLDAVIDSDDLMTATRRVQLVNEVNQRDHESYARLRRTSADLRAQRRVLEERRTAQAAALADLRDQAVAVDGKLAAAQRAAAVQAAQQAANAAAEAAAAKASVAATSTTSAPVTTTTPTPTKPTAPTAPPNYSGTPGTHPHHDDPFLSCVRRRESGGNYTAASGSGYLGAYQFSQSTWNVTANHARRPELVGVPANVATPYDQDDMAWTLWQWQGAGPWGGGCT